MTPLVHFEPHPQPPLSSVHHKYIVKVCENIIWFRQKRINSTLIRPGFLRVVFSMGVNFISFPFIFQEGLLYYQYDFKQLSTNLFREGRKWKMLTSSFICWRHYFLCNKEMLKDLKNWLNSPYWQSIVKIFISSEWYEEFQWNFQERWELS